MLMQEKHGYTDQYFITVQSLGSRLRINLTVGEGYKSHCPELLTSK